MAKLTNLHNSIYHRALIVGLSGSGKSTLAAQLASNFKLHWIGIENALDTLLKLPPEMQENVEVYNIPDSAAFPVAADTLMTLFKAGVARICDIHGKVECAVCKKEGNAFSTLDLRNLTQNDIVILDSGTQLSHSILAHTMRNKSVDTKPERDDWGALRKYTEFFGSQFQAAQFNLVVICHAIEATMEDGRTKLVPNFGSQAMSAEFGKFFSDIIYTDVKNRKHIANSDSTFSNTVLTKSRTDFRIEAYDPPSLVPLFMNAHLSVEQKERIERVQGRKDQGDAAVAMLTDVVAPNTVKEPNDTAEAHAQDIKETTAATASAASERTRLLLERAQAARKGG